MNSSALTDQIAAAVTQHGGETYLVGGGLRDALLGFSGKDTDLLVTGLDVETLARVLGAFAKVDAVGSGFGVLKVSKNNEVIDVALPRTETSTGLQHRDFAVQSDPSIRLEDDLSRRDFTVNAMAWRLRDGLLFDPFGGQEDLRLGCIRAVGEAGARFSEDPLRMLRAVRFCATLGFVIEAKTFAAIQQHAPLIQHVSAERIAQELFGLLNAPTSAHVLAALRVLRDAGLLALLIPTYAPCIGYDQHNPHHVLVLDEHMFAVVAGVVDLDGRLETRLAALLHDIAKPRTRSFSGDGVAHYHRHEIVGAGMVKDILLGLKCSNRLLETVVALVRHHMRPPIAPSPRALRKFVFDVGPLWPEALVLRVADRLAHAPDPGFDGVAWRATMQGRVAGVAEQLQHLDERQVSVSGEELMCVFGVQPGPEIGKLKQRALRAIVRGELENETSAILEFLRQTAFSRRRL